MDKNILLEHKGIMTKEEYVNLFPSHPYTFFKLKGIRLGLSVLIAIVCLLWVYTFVLGLLLISAILMMLIFPNLINNQFAKKHANTVLNGYDKQPYLQTPAHYKLFKEKIIIKGDAIYAKFDWEFLKSWRIENNWLLVQFTGLPSVYIPSDVLDKSATKKQLLSLMEDKLKKNKELNREHFLHGDNFSFHESLSPR